MVDWNNVASAFGHYAASLTSYLYKVPYGIYKGIKGAYYAYKGNFNEASYNIAGSLTSIFLWPLYSVYRAVVGTAELLFNYQIPWYPTG